MLYATRVVLLFVDSGNVRYSDLSPLLYLFTTTQRFDGTIPIISKKMTIIKIYQKVDIFLPCQSTIMREIREC